MALLRAREASMRAFRPILSEHDLTEQQWRVLRALSAAPAGLVVGDIAASTLLLGPSLSRILGLLERRALVTRERVPGDGRRAAISLTDAGLDIVRRVAPRSEAAYRRLEERYGTARLAELLDLLDDLTDAATASETAGETR